jgi:RNA polymerase sigma-70 factor (ECF subfamily)
MPEEDTFLPQTVTRSTEPSPAAPSLTDAPPKPEKTAVEHSRQDAPPSGQPSLGDEIVGYIPALRIYGRSLCRNPVEADDLVQETLIRAIENVHLFQRGTNLRAWLFTIMRNRFYSNWAKRARERTGEIDCVSSIPQGPEDTQLWHIQMREMESAIHALPPHFREAIVLVAVLGESYMQAAQTLGCDIGTIKSRINRGRAALKRQLDGA